MCARLLGCGLRGLLEEQDASWLGHEPLWLVAPHLPEWLDEMRSPMRFAPGCYWIEPPDQNFLWIAANELPLLDELIPFLMARSGQALDDFCQWLAPHRSPEWMMNMRKHVATGLQGDHFHRDHRYPGDHF